MAIEEAFDIEIPDEEAEKMPTPAAVTPALTAKLPREFAGSEPICMTETPQPAKPTTPKVT